MPQQINLFHPVLLAPRRHFPAASIAQALGLWIVTLGALAAWATWRTQSLRADVAAAAASHASQAQQLTQLLAQRQGSGADPAALAQELAVVDARLTEREGWLARLDEGAGEMPSRLLLQVAQTIPAPVWLQDLKWTPGRLELAGRTLQPEALQPWLARLGPPGTGEALQVDRHDADDAGTTAWDFRVSRALAADAKAPR